MTANDPSQSPARQRPARSSVRTSGYRGSDARPLRPPAHRRAPSPGGQVSGMVGCGIPSTSPRGYHTSARGQSFTTSAAGCVEGCPRAAARSGVRQVDGMPHEPQRARSTVVARHQKGIRTTGTPSYTTTRSGTTTSVDRPAWHQPGARTRVRDEEVAGSNPVTPTQARGPLLMPVQQRSTAVVILRAVGRSALPIPRMRRSRNDITYSFDRRMV